MTARLEPVPGPQRHLDQDIMQRLRQGTAAIHAATENLPLMRALLAPGADAADYHRYLAALHGVYLAVEPVLYGAVSPPTLNRLGVRPKLPVLQRDLALLEARLDAGLGAAPALPVSRVSRQLRAAVQNEAAAVGGLYVLEGATLGGRVIARRLRNRWGAQSGMPFSFLESRGPDPGKAWRRFGQGVRASATLWLPAGATAGGGEASSAGRSSDAVVNGAVAVFGAIHRALRDAQPGDRLQLS